MALGLKGILRSFLSRWNGALRRHRRTLGRVILRQFLNSEVHLAIELTDI
jgi:hypothetical protein